MEEAFVGLEQGQRDTREVVVSGRVLTARRLGSVLFLSLDNITSLTLFPPALPHDPTKDFPSPKDTLEQPHKQNELSPSSTATPPTNTADIPPTNTLPPEDIFSHLNTKTGETIEMPPHSVLQIAVAKEDFKGEIRENNGVMEINESLKDLSRTIAMGHTVDILGNAERNNLGQLRLACAWLKITARDRAAPNHKFMSKQDKDFQGHVPLCQFFRRGQECTKPTCPYRHAFKDERERLNSVNMQMRHQKILQLEKDPCDPHPAESKKHRHKRAEIFVEWLAVHFKDLLSSFTSTPNILDIAGGRGTVSLLLLNKGFDCVLVEPRDHKFNPKKMHKLNITIKGKFTHLQCRLDDNFVNSEEGKKVIEQANVIVGMHPDEATEAMVDLALKHNKPFAVVPCCVFPNLFPRKNKAGVSVVSYFQFIDYLLEKDPDIKMGYLDFQGRTKVLYKL